MTESTDNILILEDSQVVSRLVSETLRRTLPGAEVLQAFTVKEARELAYEIVFDLLMLDIELPDGNGLDFLLEIQKVQPGAPAIFLTATRMPEYRAKALTLGAVRFLEKPVKVTKLGELVKTMLESPKKKEGELMFRGVLSRLTPMNLVQLQCLSRATVVLVFSTPDSQSGRVHFREGEIIHAEAGNLTGEEAFYKIAGWQQGAISESDHPPTDQPTIQSNWMNLLMNAAQKIDECAAIAAEKAAKAEAAKGSAEIYKAIRKK